MPVEFSIHVINLFIVGDWTAVFTIGISLLQGRLGRVFIEAESLQDVSFYMRDKLRQDGFDESEYRRVIFDSFKIKLDMRILHRLREAAMSELKQEMLDEIVSDAKVASPVKYFPQKSAI